MHPKGIPSYTPTPFGGKGSITTLAWVGFLLMLLVGCQGGGITPGTSPALTKIETDPPGANVYLDGGFVGVSPASFFMPAKPRLQLRIEHPNYLPVDETMIRHKGTPADAEEGVGWDEVYFYPLTRKGP